MRNKKANGRGDSAAHNLPSFVQLGALESAMLRAIEALRPDQSIPDRIAIPYTVTLDAQARSVEAMFAYLRQQIDELKVLSGK